MKKDAAIEQEMNKMVEDGAFIPASREDTFVSPVFLIPKRTGGIRMIHDLREINSHLRAPPFSLLRVKEVVEVVGESRLLCVLDLQRGYQQVYMEPGARIYLGAQAGGRMYVSAVLPFSLSLSPYVFTRLTKCVAGKLREETGLKVSVYIDDFLPGANTKEELETGIEKVKELFSKLGIVLSDKKQIEVKEEVVFLGFLWSARKKTISVMKERRRKYRRIIKNLLRTAQPIARWKSTVGKLIFLREAIGPALRHVRSILKLIKGRRVVDRIKPSGEVEVDLKWWLDILTQRRDLNLRQGGVTASISTDSSDKAIGYVAEKEGWYKEGSHPVSNVYSHINTKELEALLVCLEKEEEVLKNQRVI